MTLVALVSLSFVLFSFTIKTNTQAQCLPDQHEALIQLKQGFNTIELHSWNASTNCCIWDGITCDEKTGMVTAVNLTDRHISGKLNPALFNLSSLRYLNLARNQFTNHIIPRPGFERLTNLTHLDLSYSGFAGPVPIGFSALSNLISLKLSDFSSTNTSIYNLYLDTGLKTLLRNLTKLQVLRLDSVDISLNGAEWGYAILQVGSTLQELSLAYCGLRGNLPDEIFHLTRLEYLDLESNRLTGTVPMSLFSHPSLKSFDLSHNQLSGYLYEFSNRSSILESMNLSNNNLEGRLPISLFKLPKLRGLNLESNNFNGTLNLDVIHNTKNLKYLDLSNNKLSIIEGKTHNESFYASFPQMRCIILASCNLTKIPSFLSYQTNIHIVDLSSNKIDGVMPTWGAHLTLQILDIHSNRISGPIPLLPRGIGFVDFSSNYFTSLPEYFVPSLEYLLVSDNSLMGEIPLSICNGTLLRTLDLSYNSLTGTMPPCLLVDAQLKVLDLKGNKLSGPLSRNISQGCKFRTINLSRNIINGSLPRSISNCNYLEVLDLGNNQIMDKFPFHLGYLKNLRLLVLRSNHFYGTISTMEAKTKQNDSLFSALMVFDLSSNLFRGIIPRILIQNLKAMVTNSDTITDISQGQEIGIKNSISVIDLSKNGFSGEIPIEIWQLNLLNVLNLSHNALTGQIDIPLMSMDDESLVFSMNQLESLDLSSNHLSGPIPLDLGFLPFLASLNLSYNYLVGEVPQYGNLATFSYDSYLGNPGLCGSPLLAQCVAAPLSHGMNRVLTSKSSTGIVGLSISIVLGLGVGFISVIWAMISWENGRKRFNFIIDSFYFRHFTDAYIYVRS